MVFWPWSVQPLASRVRQAKATRDLDSVEGNTACECSWTVRKRYRMMHTIKYFTISVLSQVQKATPWIEQERLQKQLRVIGVTGIILKSSVDEPSDFLQVCRAFWSSRNRDMAAYSLTHWSDVWRCAETSLLLFWASLASLSARQFQQILSNAIFACRCKWRKNGSFQSEKWMRGFARPQMKHQQYCVCTKRIDCPSFLT